MSHNHCDRFGHRVALYGSVVRCYVCWTVVFETESVFSDVVDSIFTWLFSLVESQTICPPVE